MPATPDDTDWTRPEPDTDLRPIATPPFPGVFRIEAAGEEGTPFDSLIDASTEPPMTPEAEIRGKGGCLAQSNPDWCGWVFTMLGARRLEQECGGTMGRVA